MTDGNNVNTEENGLNSEEFKIVSDLRALPRARPGLGFRARMAFYTRFPSLGERVIERRERSRIEEQLGGSRRSPHTAAVRIVTAAALVLILGFFTVAGLSVAARNTNPGDALYSVKRARENLEMAFTFDRIKRADKNLALAERRLGELEHMIESGELDPESVGALARDYNCNTQTAGEIIAEAGSGAGVQEVAGRLKEVKAAEENLEHRLAAADPVSPHPPARGATVTVSDPEGSVAFEGDERSVTADTLEDGSFTFVAELEDPADASDIQIEIEADGRRAVLPLYPFPEESDELPFNAGVTPDLDSLEIGRPQSFTLQLRDEDGISVDDLELRLEDVTGTSTLDGEDDAVTLETDDRGCCSFTVVKESLDRVSRLALEVRDGDWVDMGTVMELGGVDTGNVETCAGVTAVTNGSRRIKMANGLVEVSTGNCGSGVVIEDVRNLKNGYTTGRLSDPLSEAPVSCLGPELIQHGNGVAAYEVEYEFELEKGKLLKTYRVSLREGDPFVCVTCTLSAEGEIVESAEADRLLSVSRLETPVGTVEIGGKTYRLDQLDQELLVRFEVGRPFATVSGNPGTAIAAVPIDSGMYPNAWDLGAGNVGLRAPELSLRPGSESSFSLVVGIGNDDVLEDIEYRALQGMESGVLVTNDSDCSSGFAVKATPGYEDLKKGSQEINVRIHKQYESVFDCPPGG